MFMTRKISTIPVAPVARILQKAGAKRVSAEAAVVFAEVLEDRAKEIAEQATRIAKHTGRKTIHEGDIKLAAKK